MHLFKRAQSNPVREATKPVPDDVPAELAPFWERALKIATPATEAEIGRAAYAEAVEEIKRQDRSKGLVDVRVSASSRAEDLAARYTTERRDRYVSEITRAHQLTEARKLARAATKAAAQQASLTASMTCGICGAVGDVSYRMGLVARACQPCITTIDLVKSEATASEVVNGRTRREHAQHFLSSH